MPDDTNYPDAFATLKNQNLDKHTRTLEILIGNAFENYGNPNAIEEFFGFVTTLKSKGFIFLLERSETAESNIVYTKFFNMKFGLHENGPSNNVLRLRVEQEGHVILIRLVTSFYSFAEDIGYCLM